MKATKIGIWMDHQHAFVTEFTRSEMKSTKIVNDSSTLDKTRIFARGEDHMHSKEQQLQTDYYKKLTDVIKQYQDVVLFGPTKAKDELFNKLSSEPNSIRVKIHLIDADKMTENQRHAFVRKYFTTHPN